MMKLTKNQLGLLDIFCTTAFGLTLNQLREKNKTKFYSDKRKCLARLLYFDKHFTSKDIGLILKRGDSNVRALIQNHQFALEFDKDYQKIWEGRLKLWNEFDIPENTQPRYSNNYKPIKLKNLTTHEVKTFKSKSEAARFLRCTPQLLNYYEDKNIKEFLGFKII